MTRTRRDDTFITAMGGLYAFIYCMMASSALTDMPIYGGALYMCGRVTTVFLAAYTGAPYLPPAARRWRGALLMVMLLMNLCVVVVYPLSWGSPAMWLIFALVLSMMLRDALIQWLVRQETAGRMQVRRYLHFMSLGHGLCTLAVAAMLLYNLPLGTALPLLGGYMLCGAIVSYSARKERLGLREAADVDIEPLPALLLKAREANAVAAFERLSMAVSIALELTVVVMYTYLAATGEQMLISMALAVLTTLAFREAAEFMLRRRERRRLSDPTNLMLLGLLLWLSGLWIFSRALRDGGISLTNTYLCLGLCSAGWALCIVCLQRMEHAVANAAQFASGGNVPGYAQMRAAGQEMAMLLGEMLALVALTALCFVTGRDLPRDAEEIAARFQPVMVLPALLTVLAALLCVLRFPLSSRYMSKLARFLHIREEGGDNPALEKQLEAVVVKRHRQPFFIRAFMAVLRPFFRHRLQGSERIVQDENNPIVFLCNHGEIYGPVAAMLYIPVPVRPWVISNMTTSVQEVAEYLYKYTFGPIAWLGPARMWISRLLGRLSVWAMRQLEAIPVYRHKPRELMTTFRRSVEAMEAGDNLLIFPENPDATEIPGYQHGGMGDMFRGFPMLAQVYYNRTGKRCRFLPMYAHKGLRTLSFGEPILYDPEAEPMLERDRIVDEATRQMREMAAREDAAWRSRKA